MVRVVHQLQCDHAHRCVFVVIFVHPMDILFVHIYTMLSVSIPYPFQV